MDGDHEKPGLDAVAARSDDVDLFGRRPRHAPDWSHRRGEPRGLALGWSVFLMLAAGATFARSSVGGVFSPEAFRVAASGLMVALMFGLCVLWPMTRLSQATPRDALRSVLGDVVVLLLPAQALVWGQALLSRWPLSLCGAIAGLMLGWALVVGGVITAAAPVRRASVRAAAMAAVLAAVALPGLAAALLPAGTPAARSAAWAGPMTAVHALTRDRTWEGGLKPGLAPGDARAVSWTLVVGLGSVGAGLLARLAARGEEA